ncbi:MAG: substrate-binding domain-containing protein [Planctomycetes bacterium]|nr:substrate-binding domain-containing protein [Planctomycetota bacterium]
MRTRNPALPARAALFAALLAASLSLLAASCVPKAPPAPSPAGAPAGDPVRLRLSTTTSTENSGLLAALLPPFEKRFGIRVDVIAVGSGKALKLGETGDVDAVLAHSREAEDAFLAAGFGVNRRDVMHNDFVLVGPPGDPAGVRGAKDAAAAFRVVAEKGAPFASRGDESGTHAKEKALWAAAGARPAGAAYLETGQGMGETLVVANEKRAYCLADRGTFQAFKDKVDLAVLAEGDSALFNPYGIMAVNPARHPKAKYFEAMLLIAWLTSPEGQAIVADFRQGGEPVFFPDAVRAAK